MIIGSGFFRYEWFEQWATNPQSADGRTHGIAVARDGTFFVLHHDQPAILRFAQDGTRLDAWGDYRGGHGLTLTQEGTEERLWVVDSAEGRVEKRTLEGELLLSLTPPKHLFYKSTPYQPTALAVHPRNGDLWVADGYGAHLVHRYTAEGNYLQTLDGTEEGAAGRFDCPHGVWFDTRSDRCQLVIADRSHRRLQCYDDEGGFLRVVGAEWLTSPCSAVIVGKVMIVVELIPRLVCLDEEDRPIAILGENEGGFSVGGWPNDRQRLQAGKFNSPHGISADSAGNLYIVEWIVGGRVVQLRHAPSTITREEE